LIYLIDNGGDGLAAARHLTLFGYKSSVYYPKPTDKDLYKELVKQNKSFDIPFLDTLPDNL
jgi:NAD(P)H-hydrate epimerase